MSTVNHVFYEVHMGIGHRSCQDLLAQVGVDEIGKGSAAVFLNSRWNAAKVLLPNNLLVYWRSPTGASLTPEQLRYLPTKLQASRLVLQGKAESGLINRWNKD